MGGAHHEHSAIHKTPPFPPTQLTVPLPVLERRVHVVHVIQATAVVVAVALVVVGGGGRAIVVTVVRHARDRRRVAVIGDGRVSARL